jgi:hypothetical protein
MKTYQLFEQMSPNLADEIFTYLQKERTPVYKSVVQGLAQQRRLRPVFVERKPPAERYRWLQAALGRKVSDALAAHLLQAWLLGAQQGMLCHFLDSVGVKHDADGTVENLPDSPPKEELGKAVDQLLEKYRGEMVAVYLHAFHDMDSEASWPPLGEILQEDQRLKLGSQS